MPIIILLNIYGDEAFILLRFDKSWILAYYTPENKTPIKAFNPMTICRHQNLLLIKAQNKKVRCMTCHLTLDEKAIPDGYCPECYETTGVRRYDFEEFKSENDGKARYRCEGCGDIIIY